MCRYSGELIEPDPFAYGEDFSPMEFMDEQPGDGLDPDGNYFASSVGGYSPKSTEDLNDEDSRTCASGVDQDASLDGFLHERSPPANKENVQGGAGAAGAGAGSTKRVRKKYEDMPKRLLGNQ